MKLLLLDTETVGLPDKLEVSDSELKELGLSSKEQVQMICQLAYSIIDTEDLDSYLEISNEYCKPDIDIQYETMELIHITNEDVQNLPKIQDIKTFKKLKEKVESGEYVLIAHNIEFDKNMLLRAGLDISNCKFIDTLQVSRSFLKSETKYHRLGYLKYRYDLYKSVDKILQDKDIYTRFVKEGRIEHDALYDIIITMEFIKYLHKERGLSFEKMIQLSNSVIEYELFPFGKNKDLPISMLEDNFILYIIKNEVQDKNLEFTLNKEIEKRGGLQKLVSNTFPKLLRGLIEEDITNLKLKELATIELATKEHKMCTFNSGKHKGKHISEVPIDYLNFYYHNVSKINYIMKENMKKILDEHNKPKIEKNSIDTQKNKESVKSSIKESNTKEFPIVIESSVDDEIEKFLNDI